jgi:Transposase DDE domain
LPDHSSLTRIRTRYGIEVFRRFFEAVVEQCQQAGLVWGRELYIDGTKVQANASKDSLKPRFFVEAHLDSLFGEAREETTESSELESNQQACQEEGAGSRPVEEGAAVLKPLPTSIPQELPQDLCQQNTQRHDWIEQLGAQDRRVKGRNYQRMADYFVSTTDPDATLMETTKGADMGYRTHYVVDGGKARIILGVLVTPSEVMDNQPMRDLIFRTRFRWKLRPRQVTGDTKYGTEENLVAIEHQHIHAYIPLPDHDHRTEFFSVQEFSYDAERDVYLCPAGKELHFAPWHSTERSRRYRAYARDCNHCPRHPPSVPPVNKGAASAAVWMKRCWTGFEATKRLNLTRKPCASGRSGWNRCLLKGKTGMACIAFASVGSGASTVRRSCERRDKISNDCSQNGAGDAILSQRRHSVSSFWLPVGG